MNGFWDRWRKKLTTESAPAETPAATASRGQSPVSQTLTAEVRAALAPVLRSCAAISLGGAATSCTQSFLTGHPYLPEGQSWPMGAAGPQVFLGQINFAEVGTVPRFPATGLLQWFVDVDDTYGLTFDDTQGQAGFTARWYADPLDRTSPAPDEPTPTDGADEVPMDFVGPTALEFRPAASIPRWVELPGTVRSDPVWERLAIMLGEDRSDPEFLFDEYVRGGSTVLPELRSASKIGGYPSFTQNDPRGSGSYPALDSGRSELIVELDSMEVGGWGDAGVAHLFGDPAALASGDTDSLRYHWDCL